jgi:hypothetical protein
MNSLDENVRDVFQARRRELISSMKISIPTLAAGAVLMILVGDLDKKSSINTWIMGLTGFCLFALGIILITRKILTVYRCPKCDEVPMKLHGFWGTGGLGIKNWVILNPQVCPSCGTELK